MPSPIHYLIKYCPDPTYSKMVIQRLEFWYDPSPSLIITLKTSAFLFKHVHVLGCKKSIRESLWCCNPSVLKNDAIFYSSPDLYASNGTSRSSVQLWTSMFHAQNIDWLAGLITFTVDQPGKKTRWVNYRVSHETWQYAGRLECRLDFLYNLLRLFVNLILEVNF